MMRFVNRLSIFLSPIPVIWGAVGLLLFLFPAVVQAQLGVEPAAEVARLFLDEETITKGYTIESPGGDLKVGVVDAAVTVPVEVVLKNIPASHFPESSHTTDKVSDILEYDIRQRVDGGTESLGVLEKPIYVAIKYTVETSNKKIVHYWNKPTQEWIPLPSSTDFDNHLVRATSHFPYARLAVFDDEYAYEGPASWYVSGYYCNCMASNVYARKTKMKVTNIDPHSSKQGVAMVVTVNDYGPDPDVHGYTRPADLDKTVFAQLADSVGAGIMMVRVEPIDPESAEKYSWAVEAEAQMIAGAATSSEEQLTEQTYITPEVLSTPIKFKEDLQAALEETLPTDGEAS